VQVANKLCEAAHGLIKELGPSGAARGLLATIEGHAGILIKDLKSNAFKGQGYAQGIPEGFLERPARRVARALLLIPNVNDGDPRRVTML
jgi:hypothetical protein